MPSGVNTEDPKLYDQLLTNERHRPSRIQGRNLELEADADRGRILFSAPFRRLQNKAQVFSLESNAAVRSRLTHSLEVSSIGRLVAQEAIKSFSHEELIDLGIKDKELAFITFVENACLIHDLGNPPFGHFGEIAIANWFHNNAEDLKESFGTGLAHKWDQFYSDFRFFDGNPQGLRILTKLQPNNSNDLFGMNLTATTLAATIKYPWSPNLIGNSSDRKKAGYFLTEADAVEWIFETVNISPEKRHPLVYLMEAADDIAYCVSDIEDGIEKGIISSREFSEHMLNHISEISVIQNPDDDDKDDIVSIINSLHYLDDPKTNLDGEEVELFSAMLFLRSAIIRLLARHAGATYRNMHDSIIDGESISLVQNSNVFPILEALNKFAESSLYSSPIVRNREITAQAVLTGLLDAFKPLMSCSPERFRGILDGKHHDEDGHPIAWDRSLISRMSPKYLSVYKLAVAESAQTATENGDVKLMEKIHRMRFVVDYISGMTDEFALQSFRLISGMDTNPFRS